MVSRNFFWKLSSLLLGGGIYFLFILALIRHLGPEEYGRFAFAMGWAGLFALFVDFGFNSIIVRDLAQSPEQGLNYFKRVVAGKLMLFAGILPMVVLASLFHPNAKGILLMTLLAFVFLSAASFAEMGQSFASAYERFKTGAGLFLCHKLAIALFGILGIALGARSLGLMGAVTAASALTTVFVLYYFGRLLRARAPSAPGKSLKSILRDAFPLFVQTVFTIIYFRIDTVLLSWIRGDQETGIYNAAYRFFEVSHVLPTAFVSVIAAKLSRGAKDGTWTKSFLHYFKYFILMALGGIVVLHVTAVFLPGYLLTDVFQGSQGILKTLSFSLLFLYPNYLLVTMLNLLERQTVTAWIAGACVVLNVLANLIAIPRWGALGAAATTVGTEGFLFLSALSFIYYYDRKTRGRPA